MKVKTIINQLTEAFCEKNNPRMINLDRLRDYVGKDANASQCKIFKYKLDELKRERLMGKEEFEKHFTPKVDDAQEFDLIFNMIDSDGSGMISKKQLEILNKEEKLGLSDSDIDMMINFVSKDKQKVLKNDLYQFIKN